MLNITRILLEGDNELDEDFEHLKVEQNKPW